MIIETGEFRKLLGDDFKDAPDSEVEDIRAMLYRMADIVVGDIVREYRQRKRGESNHNPPP
jgi:hypothetical protein